jgi:hypothetical protein
MAANRWRMGGMLIWKVSGLVGNRYAFHSFSFPQPPNPPFFGIEVVAGPGLRDRLAAAAILSVIFVLLSLRSPLTARLQVANIFSSTFSLPIYHLGPPSLVFPSDGSANGVEFGLGHALLAFPSLLLPPPSPYCASNPLPYPAT